MITEYELYSDERIETRMGSRFLSIGGIICTDSGQKRLLGRLQQVRRSYALSREMRWGKVSNRHLQGYTEWVNHFSMIHTRGT
jgi:hypothetical protein